MADVVASLERALIALEQRMVSASQCLLARKVMLKIDVKLRKAHPCRVGDDANPSASRNISGRSRRASL
jgi:hypothetical protein